MFLEEWIIGLLVVVIIYLIIRIENLASRVKRLKRIICGMEGAEENLCESADTGDVEGKS